jgi:hypothetical protein
LDARNGLVPVLTIRHNAGQGGYFGRPAQRGTAAFGQRSTQGDTLFLKATTVF